MIGLHVAVHLHTINHLISLVCGCGVAWRQLPSLDAECARALAEADNSRLVLNQIDAMLGLLGSLEALEPEKPKELFYD